LVNDDNQEELTQAPGGATAIVNGQPVAVEVQAPADLPAANVDPEDRTPAQVQQLQQAANEIVDRLADVAGGNPSVSVEPTPTGAVITGLLTENVPVEDVVLVETPETATLFAALNGDGTVTEVNPGGVIQVLGDGTVGVLAYGLTPGENVELVIMSDPQLLGSFEVNDKGEVKVQAGLPDGLGAGNHTLVVASPTIQASLGLQVAERPLTLPVTGGDTDTLAPVLVMLSLGAILVVVARRRIALVP
jgi:LPXTG-motif cell wall-anchored protein